ncbi:hypothetical protein D3C86_1438700 [compost metagenome]
MSLQRELSKLTTRPRAARGPSPRQARPMLTGKWRKFRYSKLDKFMPSPTAGQSLQTLQALWAHSRKHRSCRVAAALQAAPGRDFALSDCPDIRLDMRARIVRIRTVFLVVC